jgi:multicomponent Na+:H+ antiporter subunit A
VLAGWALSGYVMAALAPWLVRRLPRAARVVLPLGPAALFVFALVWAGDVAAGRELEWAHAWVPGAGVQLAFRLDALGLLFALIVTGTGALVVRYAFDYLGGDPGLARFQALLLAFMASMLGVIAADDVVALFVFWELTSVTSFFLIGFRNEQPDARAGALQALLVTSLGGLALLAGLLLLRSAAGTASLAGIVESGARLEASALTPAAVVLVLVGAFTKSAQIPFSSWLPRAMTAPTPASAYLHAATMVKAGVYLVARLAPALAVSAAWGPALVAFGGATFLVGALRAFRETALKRVLAQSTVSALGLLVFLVGVGTPEAAIAAVVFLLAHAAYKGTLFLVAGVVDHEAGLTELSRMGGLARSMPLTAAAAAIGAASMAGLPPTLGFSGKEASLAGAASAAPWATAAVVLGGGLMLAIGLRAGVLPFVGRRSGDRPRGHDGPPGLWGVPLVLAIAGVGLALVPGLPALLAGAAEAIAGSPVDLHLALFPPPGHALVLTGATIAVGVVAHVARRRIAGIPTGLPEASGYGLSLRALDRSAAGLTHLLQTGYLRHYLLVVLAAVLPLGAYAVLSRGPPGVSLPPLDADSHEIGLAAIVVLAAITAVRSRSRLGAVVSMGAAGYGVGLIFLWFGAPDLAMTQFVVETLTVILFVLAFRHLPPYTRRSSRGVRLRDALLTGAVGAFIAALALAAHLAQVGEKVSAFFLAESQPSAHGRNVVNVILVDFRALDTLGEITVLAVAGVAVFALLKLRPQPGRPG